MDRLSKAFAIALSLFCGGPALAQQAGTVTSMPFASTPLNGSELIYLVQNGVSSKITIGNLASSTLFPLAVGSTPILNATNGYYLTDVNGVLGAQALPTTVISALNYGLRVGGSTDDSRTCTVLPSSNLLTLSAIGDFQVGDDLNCAAAGPLATLSAPANLTAVQGGTPGSTAIGYCISSDDGNGGLSAPACVTVANGNVLQTVDNSIAISYTPPNSSSPGAVWKNDVYLGAAQPSIVATMTAGSGYTPGSYAWTGVGGGCAIEPAGFIIVQVDGTISNTLGRVDPITPGVKCTSAPSVSVPTGAGAGTSGAITLAIVANFQDAGIVPATYTAGWRPYYVPAAHNTSATADQLLGTIGAINGTTATLCQLGSYPSACMAMTASTSVSGASVRHSWARGISNASAAANPGNARSGFAQVQLPCGVFETESNFTLSQNNVVFSGAAQDSGNYCTEILPSGPGNLFTVTANNDTVQNLLVEGLNKTSGYVASIQLGNQDTYQWMRPIHMAGQLQVLGANNVYVYNNPQCNDGWGYGYADYDFESTFAHQMLQVQTYNTYCNDMAKSGTRVGGTSRAGWRFNDVVTVYGWGQNAISNAEGHGRELISTTGVNYSTGVGGHTSGNSFIYILGGADAEFSTLDENYIASCTGACMMSGSSNGSITGHELVTSPGVQFDWLGGKLDSAWLGNVVLGGSDNHVVNTQIAYGSQASSGTYNGVEFTAAAQGDILSSSPIGSYDNSSHLGYPIALDAPVTATAASAIASTSPNITMAAGNSSGFKRGAVVYDVTTSQTLGTLLYWVNTTLVLQANAASNGSGSSDVLSFQGGQNLFCDNTFNGNVNNTVLDNSGNSTNTRCQNSGDASPGYAWDNVNGVFGVGPAANYSVNGSHPGLVTYETVNSGVVRSSILNGGTGNSTVASQQWSLPNFSGAQTQANLTSSSGSPTFTVTAGSGVIGGFTIDASGGGSAAPLRATGGATGGVVTGPFIVPGGASPTIATNACGTTSQGVISGTDMAGVVTVGTTGVTACAVLFAVTHVNTPKQCSLTPANATAAATGTTLAYISAVSATGFTITGSALASAKYNYLCM